MILQALRDIYGANKTSAAKDKETTLEGTQEQQIDGGREGWLNKHASRDRNSPRDRFKDGWSDWRKTGTFSVFIVEQI